MLAILPTFLLGMTIYYTEETRLGDMVRMMEVADLAGGAVSIGHSAAL